jgi:hypothetical protein
MEGAGSFGTSVNKTVYTTASKLSHYKLLTYDIHVNSVSIFTPYMTNYLSPSPLQKIEMLATLCSSCPFNIADPCH